MSQVTHLSSAQLTATDQITIELVEADETPAVVIMRWPSKILPDVDVGDGHCRGA
jgi:hypothetical protein